MRSSRLPNSALALSLLLFGAAPMAFADKNDDGYNKGNAAVSAGDVTAARDAFCAVDASYKDAAQQCTIYTGEVKRVNARYNQVFQEGVKALQDGKYDDAIASFRKVKGGQFADEAKRQIDVVIPDLKSKAAAKATADQSAAADQANQNKLNDANAAFNRGDYASAKSLAAGVGGKYASDAQNLLSRIASAESAKNTPPQQTAPAKPVREVPQLDVDRTLADAQKAFNKKSYAVAGRLYRQVLSVDHNNQTAKDGIDALPDLSATSSASEEDSLLSEYLKDFYRGDYVQFETEIKPYTFQKPPKPGLAKFYWAASIATRYYLNGASDARLLQDAKDKFK